MIKQKTFILTYVKPGFPPGEETPAPTEPPLARTVPTMTPLFVDIPKMTPIYHGEETIPPTAPLMA